MNDGSGLNQSRQIPQQYVQGRVDSWPWFPLNPKLHSLSVRKVACRLVQSNHSTPMAVLSCYIMALSSAAAGTERQDPGAVPASLAARLALERL